MYEKGKKERQWDKQPLYLPTLILPKNKFVFMFNYSDDFEEFEDDWEEQNAEEINENEWLNAAASNPAFDFLKNPEEDIYTLTDGKPFHLGLTRTASRFER